MSIIIFFLQPAFLHVDVDDFYVKSLAKFALGEIDKQTNTPYHHKLLYIVSSQIEVCKGF